MVSAAELTIDIDVDLHSSIGKLEGLATALRDVAAAQRLVDEDMNIDIDTDGIDDDGIFDKNLDLTDEEAMGVADLFNPKSAFRQTPGMGGDGGSAATADGGDDSPFLDTPDLRRLRNAFGDALDSSTLAEMGGEVTHPSQLLEGGLGGTHIDMAGVTDALFDEGSDIDLGTLEGLNGDSMDDFMRSLNQIQEFTDLPTGEGGLLQSFKDMDIRMEQMHNALAKVLPLLFVFIGALPAAIGGLVAIAGAAVAAAAAFAAIGGLGALGFAMTQQGDILENLQDVAEDMRDTFLDTFGPLARQLAPMFEAGVSGLERFFGELAARGDTLLKFRDDAMAFGRFMIDFTATAIQRLGEFSQAAMPIFAAIGEWIENTDFTNAFAQTLRRSVIALTWLADSIVRALPAMMKFSQGFLNMAAVISMFFGVLWQLINIIPGFAEALGFAVATILTALTVTALYTAANALLAMEFVTLAASAIPSAMVALYDYVAAVLLATGTSATLANIVGLLVSLFTAGLGIAAALIMFEKLNQKISETTGNLQDFGKVSGQMDGMSVGIGEGGSGRTVVNQNTYNFDGDDRDTRRSVSKARYTDMYFGGSTT